MFTSSQKEVVIMTKKKVDKRKLGIASIVILAIGILIFTLNKPKEEIDIAENNQIEEIEDKDIEKEEKEEKKKRRS